MNRFISAGHTVLAPGAIAYNGKTEHSYNAGLQVRVIDRAVNYIAYTGSSMNPVTTYEKECLRQTIKKINDNSKPGDIGCDIHFNYSLANGTEIFVHRNTSSQNKRRAVYIVNEISSLMKIPLRRMVYYRDYKYPSESDLGNLAILSDTNIPMTLPEICGLGEENMRRYDIYKEDVAQILKLAYFTYSFNKPVSFYDAYEKIITPKPKPIQRISIADRLFSFPFFRLFK